MKKNSKSALSIIFELIIFFISSGLMFIVGSFILTFLFVFVTNEYVDNMQSFIQCIVFIITSIFTWTGIKGNSITEMGLKKSSKNFLKGLAIGIISISICSVFSGNIFIIPMLSFSGLLLCILTCFCEEILLRGYVLSCIYKNYTEKKLIILCITSLVFTFIYAISNSLSILGFINIFLIQLLLGYMYLSTDNLWMSIGCHLSWNLFMATLFGVNLCSNNVFETIAIKLVGFLDPTAPAVKLSSILSYLLPFTNIFGEGSLNFLGSITCTIVLLLQIVYIYKKFNKKTTA